MGQTPSNIPQNNLVIWIHLQNYEKVTQLIEVKLKEPNFSIDKPVNKMNDTILHYAAFKRDKRLIEYLLSKGAAIDCKNSVINYLLQQRGLTPIEVTEDNDIKKLLQKKI